jgi:aspartate/tyrosine/aromatic aminotransferase
MQSSFQLSNNTVVLDPILALDEMYRTDPTSNKINLIIGVFQNEEGHTPVLPSIKEAEVELNRTEQSKAYLPIAGEAAYRVAAEQLIFGASHSALRTGRLQSLQTPGATGALRIAAEFIKDHLESAAVWLSSPAYSNHQPIMESARLATATYRYYDAERGHISFDAMLADLERAKAGDVVLLHARCHNPTGADPDPDQWDRLAGFIAERGLIPLVDAAYLGFGNGLDEDAFGLRTIVETCPEALVATSFSKIFALYSERVGMLSLLSRTEQQSQQFLERTKAYARRMYTSPPSHGARLIACVLTNASLANQWAQELVSMRQRLFDIRNGFADALESYQIDGRLFPSLRSNRGMFTLSQLTGPQVKQLREEHHIYILDNGRVSLAGMRSFDLDRLCAAIANVTTC